MKYKISQIHAIHNSKWTVAPINREGLDLYAVVEVTGGVGHIRATFMSEGGALTSLRKWIRLAQLGTIR